MISIMKGQEEFFIDTLGKRVWDSFNPFNNEQIGEIPLNCYEGLNNEIRVLGDQQERNNCSSLFIGPA